MTGAPDVAVVRDLLEALHRRDTDAVRSLTHPQARIYQAGAVPWAGTYLGPGGAVAFLGSVLEHVDPEFEIGQVFAAGPSVISIGRLRGRARTTGRWFDASVEDVVRVQDGLVVQLEAFGDADEIRRVLVPSAPRVVPARRDHLLVGAAG